MVLNIIFLPLIGSIFSGILGRFLGASGASKITIQCILFSFLFSLVYYVEVVWNGNVIFVRLGSWITSHLFFD